MDNFADTKPGIDFLVLADHAEAINGKLYMMGGGWDHFQAADLTHSARFSIAIGILVPWNATNQDHQLGIDIQDEDGSSIAPSFSLDFSSGRPPHLRQGDVQRLIFSIQTELRFPHAGGFVVLANIDGAEEKRIVFHVTKIRQTSGPN